MKGLAVNQKLSPVDQAKIRQLKAKGCSLSEIASALGNKVSKQAIAAHLKLTPPAPVVSEQKLVKVKKGAPKTAAKKKPTKKREETADDESLADSDIEADEKLERGAKLSIEALIRMFERTKMAVDQVDPTVKHQAFIQLGKFMTELADKIHALIPQPPPDPATDPANIAAREELTKRFTASVLAKEAELKRVAARAAEAAAEAASVG